MVSYSLYIDKKHQSSSAGLTALFEYGFGKLVSAISFNTIAAVKKKKPEEAKLALYTLLKSLKNIAIIKTQSPEQIKHKVLQTAENFCSLFLS